MSGLCSCKTGAKGMKCNVCPDGSKMGMNGCDKGNTHRHTLYFSPLTSLLPCVSVSLIWTVEQPLSPHSLLHPLFTFPCFIGSWEKGSQAVNRYRQLGNTLEITNDACVTYIPLIDFLLSQYHHLCFYCICRSVFSYFTISSIGYT